jgi:putative acetyltransferase
MNIRMGSIEEPAVQALLSEHRQDMYAYSPPGSVHALSLSELAESSVTLWCAWDGHELLGCGALKALDDSHGEIKSMRTADVHRRRGVAEALLRRIIEEARSRGYRRLSLETGSHEAFRPAQKLYGKYGFEFCGPFEPYAADPYSVFMSREI